MMRAQSIKWTGASKHAKERRDAIGKGNIDIDVAEK